jgi:hypothetical protein
MAFDKTKPVADSDIVSAEIRDNFNALATRHIGTTAPLSPDLGWTWLDTSNASNWLLKEYTQDGANPPAWVTSFEHMESAPTPVNGGGGGGSFTRGAVTGSYDQGSQYAKQLVAVSGFNKDAIITNFVWWPTPIGGGQFPSADATKQQILIVPSASALVGVDKIASYRGPHAATIMSHTDLDDNFAQGTAYLDIEGGPDASDDCVGVGLYDGTSIEWHAYYRYKNLGGLPAVRAYWLADGIVKSGGFQSTDYIIGARKVPVWGYRNVDDAGVLHLLVMNELGSQYTINYRIEYLYLA